MMKTIRELPKPVKTVVMIWFFVFLILGFIAGVSTTYQIAQNHYIQKTHIWAREVCPKMNDLDIKPIGEWLEEND